MNYNDFIFSRALSFINQNILVLQDEIELANFFSQYIKEINNQETREELYEFFAEKLLLLWTPASEFDYDTTEHYIYKHLCD